MQNNNTKNSLFILILIAIAFGGYYYIFSPADKTVQVHKDFEAVSQNIFDTLQKVESIKLESAILTNEVFRGLDDYSLVLVPPYPLGRDNPFAPVSSSGTIVTRPAASYTAQVVSVPEVEVEVEVEEAAVEGVDVE